MSFLATSASTGGAEFKREESTPGAPAPRRVIIDTDPGIDDALALLLAFGSEEIVVDGLTIAWGNGGNLKELGANAHLIARHAGCPSVPVSLGSIPDWFREEETDGKVEGPLLVHGVDGLGNVAVEHGRVEEDFSGFHSKPASEFIYDTCKSAPGEITLVCIAPLTNVAMALAAHSDLPELVREVVLMGGAVHGELRGNRTAAAEANFSHDPSAAQAVLTGGFKNVVMADLGITHQTDVGMLRDECLQRGQERSIPQFIAGVTQCYIDFYTKVFGSPNSPAHDVVPVMYLAHPELFTTRRGRVEVELKGELTSGMSVVDWTGRWGKPANCDVLITVDVAKFCSVFADAVDSLPCKS